MKSTKRTRQWKAKNELKYVYQNLKSNANRRGIYFNLSYEYFTKFCKETNYLALRGRNKNQMSIDRIEDELGYVDGNLQMITNLANNKKRWNASKNNNVVMERAPF